MTSHGPATPLPIEPRQSGGAGAARRSAGGDWTVTEIVKLLARQAAREWLKPGPEEGAANPKKEN